MARRDVGFTHSVDVRDRSNRSDSIEQNLVASEGLERYITTVILMLILGTLDLVGEKASNMFYLYINAIRLRPTMFIFERWRLALTSSSLTDLAAINKLVSSAIA